MFNSPHNQRLIFRTTWFMAFFATVFGQLHALSRHATADGKVDLELPMTKAWSEPASDALRPLLDWASPQTVYVTYGKFWLPAFVAATLCGFALYARRSPTRVEKWAWRVVLTGLVLATLSVVGDYFTPWLDQSFLFLGMPAVALLALGSTVLGVSLLKNSYRPRISGWLLAGFIPLFIAITQVTSMGSAFLPVIWALALAGRRASRELFATGSSGQGSAAVLAPRH